ncbi:MAG: hypothetical protein M1828_007106 [Chrysothrix sp. TS-e1954]|nr:MAG: hypothetical protein M1828_007106 [Chrysothrix sp. TS-e1954]
MTIQSTLKHLSYQIKQEIHRAKQDEVEYDFYTQNLVEHDEHCPLDDEVAFARDWYFNVHTVDKSKSQASDWPKVRVKFPNPNYQLDTRADGHKTPCKHEDCCEEDENLAPEDHCACAGPCSFQRRAASGLSDSTNSTDLKSMLSYATSEDLAVVDDGLRCSISTPSHKCKDLLCWCHQNEAMPGNPFVRFVQVECRHIFYDYLGPDHAKPKH